MIEAIKKLDNKQKAKLLDNFIDKILERNRKRGGTIYGTYQILEVIENDAIRCGFLPCPTCGKVHE